MIDNWHILEELYGMDDQQPFSSQEKPKQTAWTMFMLPYIKKTKFEKHLRCIVQGKPEPGN